MRRGERRGSVEEIAQRFGENRRTRLSRRTRGASVRMASRLTDGSASRASCRRRSRSARAKGRARRPRSPKPKYQAAQASRNQPGCQRVGAQSSQLRRGVDQRRCDIRAHLLEAGARQHNGWRQRRKGDRRFGQRLLDGALAVAQLQLDRRQGDGAQFGRHVDELVGQVDAPAAGLGGQLDRSPLDPGADAPFLGQRGFDQRLSRCRSSDARSGATMSPMV